MPLNEIEQHPYLNYFSDHHNGLELVPWNYYTRMIIGSFPVYELTSTTYPTDLVQNRHLNLELYLPFFYGSRRNQFWHILSETFNSPDPLNQPNSLMRKSAAIELLEANHVLLTDAILRTNRFTIQNGVPQPYSALDSALLNMDADPEITQHFSYNTSIIDWLFQSSNINNLFFTAKYNAVGNNPGWWFHQMSLQEGMHVEVINMTAFTQVWHVTNDLIGFDRTFNLFFLPTPSSMRSIPLTPNHQHPFLVNYMISVNPALYNELQHQDFDMNPYQKEIVSGYRRALILEWWQQYLINFNDTFDGNINN